MWPAEIKAPRSFSLLGQPFSNCVFVPPPVSLFLRLHLPSHTFPLPAVFLLNRENIHSDDLRSEVGGGGKSKRAPENMWMMLRSLKKPHSRTTRALQVKQLVDALRATNRVIQESKTREALEADTHN
jgi:hypothetical protein